MTGPCLCGDPYCPHCGGADPWAEEASEKILEALDLQTEDEAAFVEAALPALLAAYRAGVKCAAERAVAAAAEDELHARLGETARQYSLP